MAITFLQRKKIQQGFILALVAVLLITTTVLWFGFFKKGKMPTDVQDTITPTLRPVEINFGILEDPLLQALDSPSAPVLEPESVGRSNPFLPF